MTQTILITGCSSGLGRAAARLFAAKGWNVIATMRAPEREEELQHLDRVLVTRLDVEDPASIQSAMAEGIARFGAIDVLVNNAGFGAFGPLELTPVDTIRRQFEVNLFGVLAVTQAVLPHFRARKSGTIVNVTSTGGKLALPLGSLYNGSKFAIEGVSEGLYYELAPLGIAVKIVEPGAILTDFAGRSMTISNDPEETDYQPLIQAAMEAYGPMMAAGSPPEEIANIIHAAVTDGTDQLRYAAGDDAVAMLAARATSDDATILAGIRAQFGLDALLIPA